MEAAVLEIVRRIAVVPGKVAVQEIGVDQRKAAVQERVAAREMVAGQGRVVALEMVVGPEMVVGQEMAGTVLLPEVAVREMVVVLETAVGQEFPVELPGIEVDQETVLLMAEIAGLKVNMEFLHFLIYACMILNSILSKCLLS